MNYTVLGKTGLRVSRLGFGCMRFVMGPDGQVDRKLAIPLLHRALELGVNYFDTAVGYCNADSQRVLGEAFAKIPRDRIVLSTKNGFHEAPADEWWSRLVESLTFLQTDHLDIYNFHGIGWDIFTRFLDGPDGKLKLMQKAKDQGLIRHICCSFHDSCDNLIKLIDTGAFDVITLQYSLLYRDLEKGLDRAREKGTGIVVMGPVGGGRLGVDSERIRRLTCNAAQSTPEAALRFVLANPGVHVALSGMSTLAMLEDNVQTTSRPPFTPAEIQSLQEEIDRVKSSAGVYCTACGYCLPCPFGVDIPENFRVYNEHLVYGLTEQDLKAYGQIVNRAGECAECGACLSKCPQKIPIPAMLRKIMATLDPQSGPLAATLTPSSAPAADLLQTRLTLKNLTDEPVHPQLQIRLQHGAALAKPVVDFGVLAPQGSSSGLLQVSLPDGVGCLEGVIEAHAGNKSTEIPFFRPILIIPRNTPRRHRPVLDPADFSGNQEAFSTNGYALLLHSDGIALHMEFDIRSRLECLAQPPKLDGARMELFIDLRPLSKLGAPGYEDGVEQFFLYMGEDVIKSKSDRAYNLTYRRIPTATGVRLQLVLPFANFLPAGTPPPRMMGLDCMFVVFNAAGQCLGYPTYGRRQGLWANPKLFNRAFLV
jgi:predicted aldo/keto reductase-like oxidoreductase